MIALLFASQPETSVALRTLCIFLHFAFILIWQPLWHNTTELSNRTAAMLIASICGLIIWPGWLIITIWLLIIIGLLGGESAGTKTNRVLQGMAMGCLFINLLLNVVPLLFDVQLGNALAQQFAFYAALALAAAVTVLPASTRSRTAQQIDYLRAISTTLLALALASGTTLWMYRADVSYSEALFQTLLLIAALIIAINWLWTSRSGHSILQTMWNRYLLNLGTPFERYLIFLSEKSRTGKTPDEFLNAALKNLLSLDWVTGVSWSSSGQAISLGETSVHSAEVHSNDVTATVYSQNDVGPAFVLHIQLLIHLIEHFYSSLEREAELETHLRLEAIHQTGSRLTHDMKNLLQSMHYLAAVVEASNPKDAEESLQLLQRQFPELRQRVQSTLEKLQLPESETAGHASANAWWAKLKKRYTCRNVIFSDMLTEDMLVPADLFDNVAENLLENALYKQKIEKNTDIEARLFGYNQQAALSVRDNGSIIAPEIKKQLFRSGIRSSQGLGIGLYQSYQLAKRYGYTLKIDQGSDSGVEISLFRPD